MSVVGDFEKPALRHAPIDVPEATLEDLRSRLSATRWPKALEAEGWRYGLDAKELKELCDYWRDGFDWRVQEARLNSFPLYLAEVDGLDIHFWRIKSPAPGARPLLLLHGWPGSIMEFLELLGPLSNPAAHNAPGAPAFDLVVPSLPGFGFGGQPSERGWTALRVAQALHRLMFETLGYTSYLIQGGDWGTIVGGQMARLFPAHIQKLHINMPFANPPAGVAPSPEWARRMEAETGYLHLQNTKADALTMGMSDSPAGLAGWILEKFRSWSDCGGDVFSAFGKDALLANIMFYWASNSIASSTRIYCETAINGIDPFGGGKVTVPTGIAEFPAEPYIAPRSWLEATYTIQHYTVMDRGGHFAAMEQPQLLLEDIRRFFGAGA